MAGLRGVKGDTTMEKTIEHRTRVTSVGDPQGYGFRTQWFCTCGEWGNGGQKMADSHVAVMTEYRPHCATCGHLYYTHVPLNDSSAPPLACLGKDCPCMAYTKDD